MNHIIFTTLKGIKKINYFGWGIGERFNPTQKDGDGSLECNGVYAPVGKKDYYGNGQLHEMVQVEWPTYQNGGGYEWYYRGAHLIKTIDFSFNKEADSE